MRQTRTDCSVHEAHQIGKGKQLTKVELHMSWRTEFAVKLPKSKYPDVYRYMEFPPKAWYHTGPSYRGAKRGGMHPHDFAALSLHWAMPQG